MRIIYLIIKGINFPAGIENYTIEVAKRLNRKGHEVLVYAMRHYSNRKDEIIEGVPIKSIPVLRIRWLEKKCGFYLATLDLLKNFNADVIHYQGFGAGLSCAIPRLLGKKVIVQGHGLEWKRTRWNALGRIALKLMEIPSVLIPNAVIVVSKVQKQYLLEKYGINAYNVSTGINLKNIESPNIITKRFGLKENDYILYAGRLVKEKGVHYLIEAYKQIEGDIKLVIAGDSPYEMKYKNHLKKIAQNDRRIIFTGFLRGKELNELFSNTLLFVLPSDIEGLPTALLEAMSFDRVCLVSDIPENVEALNGYGYTFKAGSVNDLRNKLDHILQNINPQLGKLAGEYVRNNYCWDKIANDLEFIYKDLVKE